MRGENRKIKINLLNGNVFEIPIKFLNNIEIPRIYFEGKYNKIVVKKGKLEKLL